MSFKTVFIMQKRIFIVFLACLWFSLASFTLAGSALDLSYLYLEDIGNKISYQDLKSDHVQGMFKEPSENGLSFGWVDDPYWIEMTIHQRPFEDVLFMEIAWPLLDRLHIFIVDRDGQTIEIFELGDHLDFTNRPIFDSHFVIPINFKTHDIGTVYFNVETTSSMQLPVTFWTQQEYFKHRATYLTVQGIFYGLLLVMIFYNLFIYLSTQRIAYLHYVGFVASFGVLQLGLKGTGYQFLWPSMNVINDYAIATGGASALLFLSLFARSFLQLPNSSSLKRINNYMLVVAVGFIIASLVLPYRTVITPLAITVLVVSCAVIGMGIHRYRHGFREARFYLLAWVTVVIGCSIYLFKQLGFFPINFLTENSMQIGSAMEILILSFALADRLNTLRVRLENTNHQLELDVQKRTKELVSALEKLGKANVKLAVISTTDGLTGLGNRYHFDNALTKELLRVKRSLDRHAVVLLMLDIDHFKSVNDTWGHVVGDKVLLFVSECLRQECKRQVDTIYRYGGEEFAIILSQTCFEEAAHVAENIRHRIENSEFLEGDIHIQITISVGLASTTNLDKVLEEELIRAADLALYNAKESGRNCVHFFKGALSDNDRDKTERYLEDSFDPEATITKNK